MPGFGSGPFGKQPAGRWGWSRAVLYESIPEIYRSADAENGNLLEKYTQGQQYSFDNLRQHVDEIPALRDPFTVRTAYSERSFFTLGKQVFPSSSVEQAGALGRVFSTGTFTSQDRTTRFSPADIGKQLVIKRSNVPSNNHQTFTISSIVSDREVYTDPLIAIDSGPLRWEMRSKVDLVAGEVEVELRGGDPRLLEIGWDIFDGAQQYPIVSRQMYWQSPEDNQQLNEREAPDGTIDTAGTLGSPSYAFQHTDIGKVVFIAGPTEAEGGLYEIYDVVNGRAVFGRLEIPGANGNPFGKVGYAYAPTADRVVTISHEYVVGPDLPLVVSYQSDARNQQRFDITVTLATDSSQAVISTPAQVAAAINAHEIVSRFVEAYVPVTDGPATTVGLFDRTPIIGKRLAPTTAPVFWALRPFARITIQGDLPLGVVDAENYDLTIPPDAVGDPLHPTATTTRVFSSASPFKLGDVGKLLTIHGSTVGNDGTYEIRSVSSSGDTATLLAYLRSDTDPRYWERRTAPIIRPEPLRTNPQNYEVIANALPLIDILAKDFGITVDTQQIETRQRAWVRQVSQWIATKGTAQSIEEIAHLSGFDVEIDQLFTVEALPNMGGISTTGYDFLFIGDPGRIRYTGTLSSSGGYAIFTDPTQSFAPGDVNRVLSIANSGASPSNTNYWSISDVLSPTSVRLYQPSIGGSLGPVLPINFTEPNNGSLFSTVGQLYSDVQPSYLLMDDVEVDYLSVMADVLAVPETARPGIDRLCSLNPVVVGSAAAVPGALSACGGSTIVGVSSVDNVHTVTVQGDDLSVFIGGGWKLTDSAGTELFVDSVPSLLFSGAPVPVTYTDLDGNIQTVDTYPNALYDITVVSTTPPTTGPVAFTYICTITETCGNCASYRVLITLTAAEVLSEGSLANDNAFARVALRIEDTLPAHVEPIYNFVSVFQTGSAFFTSVTGVAEIVIPVDFAESFEYAAAWPGTAAIPTPTFPAIDATESFEFAGIWPGTAAGIPTPSFLSLDLAESFEGGGAWPGTPSPVEETATTEDGSTLILEDGETLAMD